MKFFNDWCVTLDVPDAPENVKCMSVGEDCATIVWEPPKFDGGAPIKGNAICIVLFHLCVMFKVASLF